MKTFILSALFLLFFLTIVSVSFAQNTFPSTGNVEIGSKLHVMGDIIWGNTGSTLGVDQGGAIELRGEKTVNYIDFSNDLTSDYDMRIILGGDDVLNILGGGLYVSGKIKANEIKVETPLSIPDYVFEKDYKLLSLREVEAYIKKNKHLPGIPSAQEVKNDGGLDLGLMNIKLLEKVEELTLYLISEKKENEELKAKNEDLNTKLDRIEDLLKKVVQKSK